MASSILDRLVPINNRVLIEMPKDDSDDSGLIIPEHVKQEVNAGKAFQLFKVLKVAQDGDLKNLVEPGDFVYAGFMLIEPIVIEDEAYGVLSKTVITAIIKQEKVELEDVQD